MAERLPEVDVRTREEWRQWLEANHASSTGIWLIRHKQHTGVEAMSQDELVCEALCFGWIDSLIRRLDDDRYAIKVTPRKPTSKWSDINRRRWKELQAAGLLAPAGVAAAPTSNRYAPRPSIPELPGYIATAFQADARAWQHFQSLPAGQRRNFVVWIDTARRPETRARRIGESIALLASGQRLGLK